MCIKRHSIAPKDDHSNTILPYITEKKISITQDISPICWSFELRFYGIRSCIKIREWNCHNLYINWIRLDSWSVFYFANMSMTVLPVFHSTDFVLYVRLSPLKTILTYSIEICFVVRQRIVLFYYYSFLKVLIDRRQGFQLLFIISPRSPVCL